MSILLIVSLMSINNGYVMNNLMENSLSLLLIKYVIFIKNICCTRSCFYRQQRMSNFLHMPTFSIPINGSKTGDDF